MLYTRKNTNEYDALAEEVIHFAKKAGYNDIKADFKDYERPASLTMVQQDVSLTPDFTATRDDNKHYFELVIKNGEKEEQTRLVSKWKALEMIAKMKGGSLQLFVPRGSYRFVTDILNTYNIDATVRKMSDIRSSVN